jgi:hypothetical protein
MREASARARPLSVKPTRSYAKRVRGGLWLKCTAHSEASEALSLGYPFCVVGGRKEAQKFGGGPAVCGLRTAM